MSSFVLFVFIQIIQTNAVTIYSDSMEGICVNDPCWDYTGSFEKNCDATNDCFGMQYWNAEIATVYRTIDTTNYQNIKITFHIEYDAFDNGYGCFLDYSINDTQNWINGVKQYKNNDIWSDESYDFDNSVNNQPMNFWIRFRSTSPNVVSRCWLEDINIYGDIIPPSNSPTSIPTTNPTFNPITNTPATSIPTTSIPTTSIPTTSIPTTSIPTTSIPTTSIPTTSIPTTSMPTSSNPSTVKPSTNIPTSASPTIVSSKSSLAGVTITTSLKRPETVIIATPDNVRQQSTTSVSSTGLSSTSNNYKEEVTEDKHLGIMPIIIGSAILLCAVLLCTMFIVYQYRYQSKKSKSMPAIELPKVATTSMNSDSTHNKIRVQSVHSIESEDVWSTPNGVSPNCNNNNYNIGDDEEDDDDDGMYDDIQIVDETPIQTPMQTPMQTPIDAPTNIPSIGEQGIFDNFTKGNIVTLTPI